MLGILALSLLLGGGLWGWMTFAAGDRSPRFQSITIDPQMLRFAGGRVVVQARVVDDIGVGRVSGAVAREGTQFARLAARQSHANSGEFTYTAEFLAPPNTRNDGVAAVYVVRLVAVDSTGQETTGEATFQVSPPPPPPPPPP